MRIHNDKKKFKCLFIITLVLIVKGVSAQTNSPYSQIIPPSPTSVQFQRYGDYPVSYFNGLADISIPIFTIKEGDITVPISLNYHASGTRVSDVSGFVGLGWTLEAGGMISRVINGVPDGIPDGHPMATFSVPSTTASGVNISSSWQDFKYMEDGTYDHEYDIYSYNFLGKSGKYIIQNGVPFIFQQKDNLKFSSTSLTSLYDENGIQYNFGAGGYSGLNGSNAVEYQDYHDRYSTKSAITTWQLTNITSNQHPGVGVSFYYQDGPTYQFYQDNTQYILDDWWNQLPNTNGYPPYHDGHDFQYSRWNAGVGLVQSSTWVRNFTMFLKQIDFSSGKIVFTEDPSTKMLSSVTIYDSNNTLIKTVTLNIVPFKTHNTTLNELSNYELQSVTFNDTQSNSVETYSFNYNSEEDYDAKPISSMSSAGKDYWGFYNGNDGRTHDLSWYPTIWTYDDSGFFSYTFNTPFTSVDKSPSEYYTKVYTLNKITYPTKGYTTFDYELNRDAQNNLYGGLRIKTISNYLMDGKLATQKNYTYSTGHAEITPTKDDFMTNQVGDMISAGNSIAGMAISQTGFKRTYISGNSGTDYAPQGSSVVYPSVSETNGNYSTTYSYDVGDAYTYESMDHDVNPSLPSFLSFPYSQPLSWKKISNNYKPWNFGNLLGKVTSGPSFYQAESNDYEDYVTGTARDIIIDRWLTMTTSMNGQNQPDGSNFSNSLYMANFDQIMAQNYGVSVWHYADHFYYSGGRRLKTTTTSYSTGGVNALTSVKNFYYDNSNYPSVATRVETTNSKGELINTVMTYPFDYSTTHPFDDMLTYNLITPVVQKTITNTTLSKELSKSVTNYDYFTDINTAPYPSGLTGYIAPKTIQSSLLGNALETDITVNKYDGVGNVLQLTARNGIVTTYLYGYNNKYPVAKIIGKDYATVSGYINQSVLDAPGNDAALRAQLNNLRTSFPDAQVSTYTYKPLVGMTSSTDPKGQITTYEYDNFQRLQTIRDQDGKILKSYTYNYQH